MRLKKEREESKGKKGGKKGANKREEFPKQLIN
jgi:hypothetical protein